MTTSADDYETPTEYEGGYDDGPDPDVERDRFFAEVDAGKRCPDCYYTGRNLSTVNANGIRAFRCPCGSVWHDFITRATVAA